MMRIAINGFGRIGRCVLRALCQRGDELQVVAINDLAEPEAMAHLLQFDSVHGRLDADLALDGERLQVAGQSIAILRQPQPQQCQWGQMGAQLVLECTGRFGSRAALQQHLDGGAQSVLASAPVADADRTLVYGVNDDSLQDDDRIISNGSCTTNCLAPLAQALHRSVGIRGGLINTVHAYTSDQRLVDSAHADLRRARAAAQSLIPTSTGAARAIAEVLPELRGLMDGKAVRAPIGAVSLLDLTFRPAKPCTAQAVNAAVAEHAKAIPEVLQVNHLPLVSSDFRSHPASCIFDATQTQVLEDGQLVKVLAWYDNEWGFANRMLDNARRICARR